jgi:hypothetical protein
MCEQCKVLENKITLLESQKEELEKLGSPSVPLVYCKEHKTICMPFAGKLACCLVARIKELEDGIEKHRSVHYNREMLELDYILTPWDEELYKLVEKK